MNLKVSLVWFALPKYHKARQSNIKCTVQMARHMSKLVPVPAASDHIGAGVALSSQHCLITAATTS